MFSQTFQNHLRFGYGDDFQLSRITGNEPFNLKFGACSYRPTSFQSELERAAKLLRDSTSEPLHIWLSGGVDSHAVLWAFISARIPVQVIIMRWKYDFNLHDISHAVVMCEKFKIPYRFINLDYNYFIENDYREIAFKYNAVGPSMAAIIHLLDKNFDKGCHILGGGEPEFEKYCPETKVTNHNNIENMKWKLLDCEKYYSIQRYFEMTNRKGVPGFIQYTPELLYSFCKHPVMKQMLSDKFKDVKNSFQIKHKIYGSLTPDIYRRKKVHGFEKYANGAPFEFQDIKQNVRNDSVWISLDTLDTWFNIGNS